jgi:glyoxylase-like metal-dependent hydrolase (beta-lactamase superfamily II)/ferredoxin
MAQRARRHLANAPGPWFVDTSCIDCDASRQCAPAIFAERDGQSVVVKQPETPEEIRAATRALVACPTASIGVEGEKPDPHGLFPQELERGVFYAGFNSEDSFGANSFFVRRPEGNLLVDSPRWASALERAFLAMGGISMILLTHRDDVADADRYAERFEARVVIHEADRSAAPFATDLVRGLEPAELRPGLSAIPVPGHTRGSVVYLLEDEYLFTGDSLYRSRELGTLSAFRDACWYSWSEQARSLARLSEIARFEWVLAGHGDRGRASAEWNRAALVALVERMRSGVGLDGEW